MLILRPPGVSPQATDRRPFGAGSGMPASLRSSAPSSPSVRAEGGRFRSLRKPFRPFRKRFGCSGNRSGRSGSVLDAPKTVPDVPEDVSDAPKTVSDAPEAFWNPPETFWKLRKTFRPSVPGVPQRFQLFLDLFRHLLLAQAVLHPGEALLDLLPHRCQPRRRLRRQDLRLTGIVGEVVVLLCADRELVAGGHVGDADRVEAGGIVDQFPAVGEEGVDGSRP